MIKKQTLLLSFITLALLPIVTITIIAISISNNALEKQAFNQLTSIKISKLLKFRIILHKVKRTYHL